MRKRAPFPLNRAVPSEAVTDTKNMWTFLRTNFCDPWMEVPLNRGFPNLNESFHCIWMSTDSLYMRNIKLLTITSQDFRLQKESSRLRWLLLEPELLWSLTNALQSTELSALRNTSYLDPGTKYKTPYVSVFICNFYFYLTTYSIQIKQFLFYPVYNNDT